MKEIVVEIAQFKLTEGANQQEFLEEAENVQKEFLESQSGYLDRELLKDAEGQWGDILH